MNRKFVVAWMLAAMAVFGAACTDNTRVRRYGGEMTIDLPKGSKLVNVTWKDNDLWYLVRKANPGEGTQEYLFVEKSRLGIQEGTVKLKEHL